MTPDEFRRAGERIALATPEASTRDWRKGLAQRSKIPMEEIDRYASGEIPVPLEVAAEVARLTDEGAGASTEPRAGAAAAPTPGEAAGEPTLGGVPESGQPIPAGGYPSRGEPR